MPGVFSMVMLAYCINAVNGNTGTTCSKPDSTGGPELHWELNSVPYMFADGGSGDLGQEVFPALDDGFQVWNDDSGIGFSYGGCSTKGKSSIIDGDGDANTDGDNLVAWVESNWPYSAATIALTWNHFYEDGEIGETDIVMNGEDYTWTTASAGGDTDVQSITAHEAGHYLGLAHTNVTDATMYPTVIQGETSKRSLASDDIQGAQVLYGSGPSGGSVYDPNEACTGGGAEEGEGCACSLEGTARPRPGLMHGIAGTLALLGAGMMRLRGVRLARAAIAPALLIALLAGAPASATVMIDQSLEDLARHSESVVHGDVLSVETLTDGKTIWTTQRIRVREVLAGLDAGDVVEVITPGGVLPEGVEGPRGYRGMRAHGIPEFEAGEEVVVFLQRRRGGADLTVTALQQGKLNVRRDAKGIATIERDLSGVVRMEKIDGEGLRPVGPDGLSGMALEELLERIRPMPTRVTGGR